MLGMFRVASAESRWPVALAKDLFAGRSRSGLDARAQHGANTLRHARSRIWRCYIRPLPLGVLISARLEVGG